MKPLARSREADADADGDDGNNQPAAVLLAVSPHGKLYLTHDAEGAALAPPLLARLSAAFDRHQGHGLLLLGTTEVDSDLPPDFAYFRDLARRFVTALCSIADAEELRESVQVALPKDLDALAAQAPPLRGAEYLSGEVLGDLWKGMQTALQVELRETDETVQQYLKRKNPLWNLVGRVCFHLVENKRDPAAPFAFMATYAARLSHKSNKSTIQHVALRKALSEYGGDENKDALLALLLPVERAAKRSPVVSELLATRELFHPLRWTPAEAFRFLQDVPALEDCGVVVRLPDLWQSRRPPRPQVSVTVGDANVPKLGTSALLDFSVAVTLEGEVLSEAELEEILRSSAGLVLLKGRWVEVDQQKLRAALEYWQNAKKAAARDGISFVEAMRMLAGADGLGAGPGGGDGVPPGQSDSGAWSQVVAGAFLGQMLDRLRSPETLAAAAPGTALRATLRPYQQVGVQWLYFLAQLGLGACLADDMGLGKTVQVLALLLMLKKEKTNRPALLVAPASLLGNWQAEVAKFTPTLKVLVGHPSVTPSAELSRKTPADLAGLDLVITSYGSVYRFPVFSQADFRLIVLDEAQAIKNPTAKQTRAVKALHGGARIALTGTPVENRLSDLWSIFDFLCPGLLGNSSEFNRFVKRTADAKHNPYGPLRTLIRPYLLRRLKTDKRVIADLPDKTELLAYCSLSKKQAALYEGAVDELREQLEVTDGMKRRGMILSFLLRFKQICNHPSQWLGDHGYDAAESGKFARLRELCEAIASRQEKVLVFTQFREMTGPLAAFLAQVFGQPGLVLHGETAIKQRAVLVDSFQREPGPPFFVLSLKAGGTGLNLTAASHVIHFDRWWNPAVEAQASDRAFRIGQKRNVLVHKFVCRGTVEEKIDELITAKQGMAQGLLEGDGEIPLTEMNNEDLLRLVSLDMKRAIDES